MTVMVGTGGGAFANESCLQDWKFDQFFSNAQGLPGGMLVAGTDSHIS